MSTLPISQALQRPALEGSAAQRTSRPGGWWREPPVGRPPSPAPPARPRDTGARTLPMPPSPAGVRCHALSAPVVQDSYAALRPSCGLRWHQRSPGSPCMEQYWNSPCIRLQVSQRHGACDQSPRIVLNIPVSATRLSQLVIQVILYVVRIDLVCMGHRCCAATL